MNHLNLPMVKDFMKDAPAPLLVTSFGSDGPTEVLLYANLI